MADLKNGALIHLPELRTVGRHEEKAEKQIKRAKTPKILRASVNIVCPGKLLHNESVYIRSTVTQDFRARCFISPDVMDVCCAMDHVSQGSD